MPVQAQIVGLENNMDPRRSEYDVSNRIDTTDPASVEGEVRRLHADLYPRAQTSTLSRAFDDCTRMYRGAHPAYRACDTAYHDLQHTLDVSLAMARLMDGYQRSASRAEPIGERLFVFGIVAALFHDIGYLRRRNDTRHQNGAEYTLRHVSRGGRFLHRYLADIGLADLAAFGAELIHFTGYEMPVSAIRVPSPLFRRIGNMLGTADIIAQMSDRCYLEKCRDRLYPEFVVGGLASRGGAESAPGAQFSSAEDLLNKTPAFYLTAERRLGELLGGAVDYARTHFGGRNLYLDAVQKNVSHARRVAQLGEVRGLLRRNPPARADQAVRLAA
jgi:hypothetical protein